MVVAKSWKIKKVVIGKPTPDNFELCSNEVGDLKVGDVLTKTLFITVDPYLRGVMRRLPVGSVIPSQQVCKVVESKDVDYPIGTILLTRNGWCDYARINPKTSNTGPRSVEIASNIGNLSLSLLVGACGMPGVTAYWGFLDICKPIAGETLFVNAAAGAVGSIVGQIAKIKGLKVIASAGDDEKVLWLKDELKFDYVFNYKKMSTEEALNEGAPDGIDCFFENVGGSASTEVIKKMNKNGRIAICGAISVYKDEKPTMVPSFIQFMIYNQIKMEGFVVTKYQDRWNEAVLKLSEWVRDGKLKVKETVMEGIESTPNAFIDLFNGTNTGKMIIRI